MDRTADSNPEGDTVVAAGMQGKDYSAWYWQEDVAMFAQVGTAAVRLVSVLKLSVPRGWNSLTVIHWGVCSGTGLNQRLLGRW
jgi:hypothetical protein